MKTSILLIGLIISIVVFSGCAQVNTQANCNNLETQAQKDDCFNKNGIAQGNSGECIKIQDKPLRDSCIVAVAQKNLGNICEKQTDIAKKDFCYADLAGSKKDPTICENVQTLESKDKCYTSLALLLKDKSVCENIQNTKNKDDCLAWFKS